MRMLMLLALAAGFAGLAHWLIPRFVIASCLAAMCAVSAPFAIGCVQQGYVDKFICIGFPIGFAASLPVAMMVGLPFAIVRGRARKPPTACQCGYDLTGNESGACPECGASLTIAQRRAIQQ